MLSVITLKCIDEIFSSLENKLTPYAQIFYINCLMHRFRNLKANVVNATAFEIKKTEFENFEKYKNQLLELEKAGLVYINGEVILFANAWGRFIDRSLLDKVTPSGYVGSMNVFGVDKFVVDLKNSSTLHELISMKFKISKKQTLELMDLFIKEQNATEQRYFNYGECAKHCTNWIGKNANLSQKEKVTSNNRLLM